jgi:hypothetical protein
MDIIQASNNAIPRMPCLLEEEYSRRLKNARDLRIGLELDLTWHFIVWEEGHIPAKDSQEEPYTPNNTFIPDVRAIYQPFYNLIRHYILQNNCTLNSQDAEQREKIKKSIVQQTQCRYAPNGWEPTDQALKRLLQLYRQYWNKQKKKFYDSIPNGIIIENENIEQIKQRFAQSSQSKYCDEGWILSDQEVYLLLNEYQKYCWKKKKYSFYKTISNYMLERPSIINYKDPEQRQQIQQRFISGGGILTDDKELTLLLNEYQQYWNRQKSRFYKVIQNYILEHQSIINYQDPEQRQKIKQRFTTITKPKYFDQGWSLTDQEVYLLLKEYQETHTSADVKQGKRNKAVKHTASIQTKPHSSAASDTAIIPMTISASQKFSINKTEPTATLYTDYSVCPDLLKGAYPNRWDTTRYEGYPAAPYSGYEANIAIPTYPNNPNYFFFNNDVSTTVFQANYFTPDSIPTPYNPNSFFNNEASTTAPEMTGVYR